MLDLSVKSPIVMLFLLFLCFELHILSDFHLQGILANMKQKSWWKNMLNKNYDSNIPLRKTIYKHDYVVSLFIHAFETTFISFLAFIPFCINSTTCCIATYILFGTTVVIHAVVDSLKCNRLNISLKEDQLFHLNILFLTWLLNVILTYLEV